MRNLQWPIWLGADPEHRDLVGGNPDRAEAEIGASHLREVLPGRDAYVGNLQWCLDCNTGLRPDSTCACR